MTPGSAEPGTPADPPAPQPGGLHPVALDPCAGALPERLAALVAEGLRRSREIDCFDFVPCEPLALHGMLASLASRGARRYCEWGSGIGIGAAIALAQGFDACGIELHAGLADASRQLLADFGLRAEILTGSYFEIGRDADVYFAYCWPSQLARMEEHFVARAPDAALLVTAHGAADLRCKVKHAGLRARWEAQD